MKIIKLSYALLGLAVLSFCSCGDFLDKEPDLRTNINSEESVRLLLVNAYPETNYGYVCEMSCDNIVDNNAPYYDEGSKRTVKYNLKSSMGRMADQLFRFDDVRENSGNDSPYRVWETFYKSIAICNNALEAIATQAGTDNSKLSDLMKANKGEALLVRAYCHFILVNIFSQAYKNEEKSAKDIGIPYVTIPETEVSVNYDRGTVADVYKKIQSDLEEGLSLINERYYKAPKWHFNINAAHAFAARFYLFKRDYDKVIEHADAVLGTDYDALPSLLMDYSGFDKCIYSTDFAVQWQNPESRNSLMLISTVSTIFRYFAGGARYACNHDPMYDIFIRMGPTGGRGLLPAASVSGLFTNGGSEYGCLTGKICERFEYTDKVAGIGYVHTIRREFTCNELLLERAEAKLLKANPDFDGCANDLIAYQNSLQTFSAANKQYFSLSQLTQNKLLSYYRAGSKQPNCFSDWNFTQEISPDFVVSQEQVPYMNCINDYRRYETVMEGNRFFDLKRWGMPFSRTWGPQAEKIDVVSNDVRLALEIPQEVIMAGLTPSRSVAK